MDKPSDINPNTDIFESHWKSDQLNHAPGSKKVTAIKFLNSSEIVFSQLAKDYRILDAGCGNGVHAEVLNEMNSDISYVGVDISSSAISHCVMKFPKWGSFAVADISRLNFPDESFDLTLCYGVLFYTANPLQTLTELARVTKKNGVIGLWYMPDQPGVAFKIFRSIRALFRLIGPRVSSFFLNLLVPFLYFIPTQSKINLANASWSECLEVLKVNFIPEVKFPNTAEVEIMIRDCGLRILKMDQLQNQTLWLNKT